MIAPSTSAAARASARCAAPVAQAPTQTIGVLLVLSAVVASGGRPPHPPSTPSTSSNFACRTVSPGDHYAAPVLPVGFVDTEVRTVQIRFDPSAAAYACNCTAEPYPGCMGSWNKLWGSSRCGYSHPHHQDSDRFVWRRRALNSSDIAIAAYSCEQDTTAPTARK